MAEVQNRHREAAKAWLKNKGYDVTGQRIEGPRSAPDTEWIPDYAQGLADAEAEIAEGLADIETPALVIQEGYNDGFQLGILAAVTWVRSGGWMAK